MSITHTFYDVIFAPGGKRYNYLAGGKKYVVSEFVTVPTGRDERETIAKIVEMRNYNPSELCFPAEQLKTILRRASAEERVAFGRIAPKPSGKPRDKKDVASNTTNNVYVTDGLQPDGSLIICYEDYGVDSFDGMDYEVIYELNPENTKRLQEYLSAKHTGGIEYMIIQECGQGYRKKALTELFEEAGVEYTHFFWIS